MKKIFITGIAGTGKTTVCKELDTLGYTAYDIEDIEGMFKMYRKGTREVFDDFDNADPEKIKNSEWICDTGQLQKLLSEQKTNVAFYCGVASNMDDLIPLFDTFILLKTNAGTLHSRLSNREGTEDMGNTEESRQTVLGWKDWWEEEMTDRGAIIVNADGTPDEVTEKILSFANTPKTEMKPQLFIVTGVNGIGKSSVIPGLKRTLDPVSFAVHDFDERGVPNNADREWRKSEMKHWTTVAEHNLTENISTIVCGFIKASDIKFALEETADINANVCVLDASPETISRRILSRYTTPESLVELERTMGKIPEKFVSDNVWVASKFREEANENGYYILDTNEKNPDQVATDIIDWIKTRNT